MKATVKAPAIDALINAVAGKNRVETIANQRCMTCGNTDLSFRDELSKREYAISGMCQDCQDSVFGGDE